MVFVVNGLGGGLYITWCVYIFEFSGGGWFRAKLFLGLVCVCVCPRRKMGVSENRGPEYSTLNSRILITRTPKQGTLIFGKSHIWKAQTGDVSRGRNLAHLLFRAWHAPSIASRFRASGLGFRDLCLGFSIAA